MVVENNNNNKISFTPPVTDLVLAQEWNKASNKRDIAVKEHSWLEKGHPLGEPKNMDWPFFGLLCGDSFIEGTPFEGGSLNHSITFFHHFIDQCLNKAEQDPQNTPFDKKYIKQLKEFQEEMEFANTIDNATSLDHEKGHTVGMALEEGSAAEVINVRVRK